VRRHSEPGGPNATKFGVAAKFTKVSQETPRGPAPGSSKQAAALSAWTAQNQHDPPGQECSFQAGEADDDICSSEVQCELENLEKRAREVFHQGRAEDSDSRALQTLRLDMNDQCAEMAMVRQDLDEQKKQMTMVHERLLTLAEQLEQVEEVHEKLPALAKQVATVATAMDSLRCTTAISGDSGGTFTPQRRLSFADDMPDGILQPHAFNDITDSFYDSLQSDHIKKPGSAKERILDDCKIFVRARPMLEDFVTLQQLSESCAELERELQVTANVIESNCKSQHEELRQNLAKFEDELKEIRSAQEKQQQQPKPYIRLADISANTDLNALVGHEANGPIHRLRAYSKADPNGCNNEAGGSQELSTQVPLTAFTTEKELSHRKISSDMSSEEVKEFKIETLIVNGCHMP
jgi:hypothetical protein